MYSDKETRTSQEMCEKINGNWNELSWMARSEKKKLYQFIEDVINFNLECRMANQEEYWTCYIYEISLWRWFLIYKFYLHGDMKELMIKVLALDMKNDKVFLGAFMDDWKFLEMF